MAERCIMIIESQVEPRPFPLAAGVAWRDECNPQGINVSSSTHIFNPWGQVFRFFLSINNSAAVFSQSFILCCSWTVVFWVGWWGLLQDWVCVFVRVCVVRDETRLWSTGPHRPVVGLVNLQDWQCNFSARCFWQAKCCNVWNVLLCLIFFFFLTAACPCGGSAGTDPDFSKAFPTCRSLWGRICAACFVCLIWV